jgi:hypothetical protein
MTQCVECKKKVVSTYETDWEFAYVDVLHSTECLQLSFCSSKCRNIFFDRTKVYNRKMTND